MPNPIVTIDKFGGMDNLFLAQSIAPKTISGQSVLSPRYKTELIADVTDLGMPTQFAISSAGFTVFFITDLGKIGYINTNTLTVKEVLTVSQTSPVNKRSGLFRNSISNIIYAHKNNIGLAFLDVVVISSPSTVDTSFNITNSPYNFVVGGKAYDLTNDVLYTVTAVSGTQVTLNTTELTGGSLTMLFFRDNRWSLSGHVGYNQNLDTYDRQIIQNGQEVFIANGNDVASFMLSGTLGFDSFTSDAIGLPSLMRVTCMASNSDRMLIGGDQQGIGYIVYWDGTVGSYQNIFETTSPPKLIQPYKNGFVYLTGSTLRYTDGLQDQLLARIPDVYTTTEDVEAYPNASTLLNDKIIIGMSPTNSSGRAKKCLWAFDPENGFVQIPLYSSLHGVATEELTIGALYKVRIPSPFVYVSVRSGNKCFILKLTDEPAEKWRASFFLKFPQKVPVSSVSLNLGKNSEIVGSSQTSKITVAVSDVLYPYFNKFTLTNDVHTVRQIYANNFSENPEVGDLVVCTSRDAAGQFAFIEQIEDLGTKYLITLDKDLDIAPSANSKWNLHKARKTETRQITSGNTVFDNNFNLQKGFNTDQVIVDIFAEDAKQIQINSLSINQ